MARRLEQRTVYPEVDLADEWGPADEETQRAFVRVAGEEDEYSYPPSEQGPDGDGGHVDLEPLGVQITAPSKRRVATHTLHAAPLSDAAIARIKARAKRRP